MKYLSVIGAKHIKDTCIEVVFNDGKKNIIDFSKFFDTHHHPQYNKYRKEENFKKFKIENGNIVWGKDWDMIFPVDELYQGKIC